MSGGLAYLGLGEAGELIRAKKLSPVDPAYHSLGQRTVRKQGRASNE
jgi:hypothetical protein